MSLRITEDCVGCGTCVAACPVEAIKEKGTIFEISAECLECGLCLGVCALGAIIEESDSVQNSPEF